MFSGFKDKVCIHVHFGVVWSSFCASNGLHMLGSKKMDEIEDQMSIGLNDDVKNWIQDK